MRLLKWVLQKRHYAYMLAIMAAGGVLLSNGMQGRHTSAQGTNSMYVTPASGTYAVGANYTLSVRINTTDQVNAVTADLTYSSNLQFVSIDGSGSAFAIDASSSGGSGTVSINRATITPVSGDQLVAKVTFKALSAGNGTVTVANSSQALSSSTNTNVIAARNGGAYTLQGASTPTPTPTTPSPSPATPTAPSPSPSPTPSTPQAKTTNLPKTTIAAQGNSSTTPLPGDSKVELSAPATVETTTDGTKEVAKVEYLLNGKVVSTDTTPPYAHNIDTTRLRNGTYALTTKTHYRDGKIDSSKASLLVNNPFGLTQLWLQLKHYAWIIIILLVVAGELIYLRFFRGRTLFPKIDKPSSTASTSAGSGPVVGGGPIAGAGAAGGSTGAPTVISPSPKP